MPFESHLTQLGSLSHHVIRLAWFSGAVLSSLVFLLMGVVLVLRLLLVLKQRRRARFLAIWQPVLLESLADPTGTDFPPVPAGDWLTLLQHWNHLHGFLRGESKERLVTIGHELGMVTVARRLLARRSTRLRLLALLTLGNLRASYSWKSLVELATSRDPHLSLAAIRAIAAINSAAAIGILVPEIAQRADWSPVMVASVLHEIGYERVAVALAETARRLPAEQATRLIRLLSPAQCTGAGPILREMLRTAADERLISVLLQALKEPEDLELARGFLSHPQWFIRVQAASAVGRIGLPGDERLLIALLHDEQWWVRYRAAQALVNLPWYSLADLAHLGADHEDRYARDIVIQVLAEAAVQ